MQSLSQKFDGVLEIKPKNISNWIEYSSHIIGGNLDKVFETASILNISLADPCKSLRTSVNVGFDVRFKMGFDGQSNNWLFWGSIPPNSDDGMRLTESGISLSSLDFISNLAVEPVLKTKPGEGIKNINNNISFSENYDGDECFNAIQNNVNNMEGTPLTVLGKGTNPQMTISADDDIYPNWEDRKSVIDSILELCTDYDLSTNTFPLPYHYYQINDDTSSYFKFIKEVEPDSATPLASIDDDNLMLSNNEVNNIEQFTSAVVKDTDISYRDEDAISKYGLKTKVLEKKYSSQERNHRYAVDTVNQFKLPRYSFEVLLFGGMEFELGNIIQIQSDRNPRINGNHTISGINYSFSQDTVTTKLTLNNIRTKLLDVL